MDSRSLFSRLSLPATIAARYAEFMTDADPPSEPEKHDLADLAERLSKLDLENPADLEALFQLQEEISAVAGLDFEAPLNAADLPVIEPDPEPSDAYLAAADATVPLTDFIERVGSDVQDRIATQTLLFPACLTGSLEKAQWLIDQGLDPDHRDKDGYSPLIYACLSGINANLELIRFLIEMGADVNAASSHNESPLRLSLRNGNYAAVRMLLDAGADSEKILFSPMHRAAAFGDLDAITKLMAPQTLEAEDTWNRTPWLTAIHADQVDAARFLKSCGANETVTSHIGSSAIHLAAGANACNSLRYLLSLDVDIESRDRYQGTPLHEAVENGALEAAALLIHAGANVNVTTHTQDAPIHNACSVEMLKLLHEAGADLNQISGEGCWPLWDAAEDGDLRCLQWLIDSGAEVNRTSTGATALHAAVNGDDLPAIEFLLKLGAHIDAQDVDGETALFYARSTDAARLLLESRADPSISDQCGYLPTDASRIPEEVRNFIRQFSAPNSGS